MDTSDPKITFDKNGVCDFANNYYKYILPNWHPNEIGIKKITPLIEKIKNDGKGKEHDCIIGISGGLDSSFVTHIAKEKFGLRPLMFHCDTGWNSDLELAIFKKIIEGLNLDLVTEVINWNEMKDLQRAFFKSQVPFVDTQDLPFSAMYNFASKHKFKYVITGGNNSTEVVRESVDWTYFSTDTLHARDIHKKFGEIELKTFPMRDIFKYRIYDKFIKGMKIIKLLDSVPFIKKDAIKELNAIYMDGNPISKNIMNQDSQDFMNLFGHPKKHGFDKRRAYFSSEILTGQMSRDEALERISKPELSEEEMRKEFEYIAKKLDFSVDEFTEIFNGKNKSFRDYKTIIFG